MSNQISDCCAAVPRIVSSGYEFKGKDLKTPKGLTYYEVVPTEIKYADVAVVVIYDIIGPNNPQTTQQVDRISAGLGVKVVSPDWFGHGAGYSGSLGPNTDRNDLGAWVAKHGSSETFKERATDIVEVLRGQGYTKIPVVGFCIGGRRAFELARTTDLFTAAGSIHGAAYTAEEGATTRIPVINLPSMKEGNQPEFMAALPDGIREKSEFKLFGDMPHGWAAARGNWEQDPSHKQRAEEVIEDFVNWVKKVAV